MGRTLETHIRNESTRGTETASGNKDRFVGIQFKQEIQLNTLWKTKKARGKEVDNSLFLLLRVAAIVQVLHD